MKVQFIVLLLVLSGCQQRISNEECEAAGGRYFYGGNGSKQCFQKEMFIDRREPDEQA